MPDNPAAPVTADDPRHDFEGSGYRYLNTIGSGAMGDVIDAEDVRLRTRVAIKRLKTLKTTDPVEVARAHDRLRLEGELQAKLVHPTLVRVFAAGVTRSGFPFLVSERLFGRTLGAEIDVQGFIPLKDALTIACAMLDGLGFAHGHHIVHRDIKPDNIFVTDDRKIKILDFGLAKITDTSRDPNAPAALVIPTATGVALGSPRYMSPEQVRGDKQIDGRADLYAVGAVLYKMVSGHSHTDPNKTVVEVMKAQLLTVPPAPSINAMQEVPPDVDRAILKALAKTREERFQSAQEFAAELTRIAQGLSRQSVGPSAVRGGGTEIFTAPTSLPAPKQQAQGVAGTMLMADDPAIKGVVQAHRDSLASSPPSTRTTAIPQATPPITAPPQSRPSAVPPVGATVVRSVDMTLPSKAMPDQDAAKQRRMLAMIGIFTVVSLGVLVTIAMLILR